MAPGLGKEAMTKAPLNLSHQAKLFNPKFARKVVLFGAGSVGSYVAFFLAKMGVTEIEVWDGDDVASHNIPMSLYRPKDVGRYKVDALREIILEFTGVTITAKQAMYEGKEPLKNVSVISCVDTMKARSLIWSKVRMNPSVDIFLDTRIGEAYQEVFAISPCSTTDIKRYRALLFDDKEAVRRFCGSHGVVFVSTKAAQGVTANIARFWQTGQKKWRDAGRCDILDSAV